jgi:hypothetical protein
VDTRRSWLRRLTPGIFLIAALVVAIRVSAQPARPEPSEPRDRFAAAKLRLKLTVEQEPKVRALLEDEAAKLRAVKAQYGGDDTLHTRTAKLREVRAIQDDLRARLKIVLTAPQLNEWDKLVDEARAEARERHRQR